MNKTAVQKCRTCLKSSEKTFSLNELPTECSPKKTYGQLLKEYAKLECTVDYEHLMPQYLCLLCCRKVINIYAFIKQAQCCNDKLLQIISKKLECLREKIIDVPENENELEKAVDIQIKAIGNFSTTKQKEKQNMETNETRKENLIEKSEGSESYEINNIEEKIEEEICIIEENETKDMPLELLETVTNNFEYNAKECPLYEKNMSQPIELKIQMRTQHDIERPINLIHKQRLEVKKIFDYKQRLEARKTFDCKLCPSKYSNRYSYVYHLIHKHNIDERKRKEKGIVKPKAKILKCKLCDYTARTYAALNYHTRGKHGTENDKFKCEFCKYMCLKKFDLLTHVKSVHKELIKTLKAEAENNGEVIRKELSDVKTSVLDKMEPVDDNSDEEFSSDDNTPLVKRTNSSKIVIEEDEEQFSDEDFIRKILNIKKRHIKPSTTSLARKCEECGNIYKNYRALYAHQKQVHISDDKYSLCPQCGKKYKRKTDLRIHIERHHVPKNANEISKQPAKVREKRFMCPQCSYVCTTITILNIHISRKHTGEKPYKCDICFKSFLVPYDLKIHRYLHTGERPYKCPICSKGFRDNSHMRKHKRIHSSERPFKCEECGKCFAIAYYLSVHNRTHLKEKKLNCVTCKKVFESRSLLNLHRMNENHQDEVV